MVRFFIDHPVFAMVISIVIVLGGLVSMKATPVAQFPDIAPPTVQVTARYPGATAEVIANTVAAPVIMPRERNCLRVTGRLWPSINRGLISSRVDDFLRTVVLPINEP